MTGRTPYFSVVIPTHNRPVFLKRAINSVLAQGMGDFELIVVDDASTDETEETVKSIGDPRVKYIKRPVNGGAAAARNDGVRAARGEVVAFLDDDDEYTPGFLEETKKVYDGENDVGFTWCYARVVRDVPGGEEKIISEGGWRPEFSTKEEAYLSFLKSRRLGTNCGIAVRRECFDKSGLFDDELKKAEDTDILIRLVHLFNFRVITFVGVKVHQHDMLNLTQYDAPMADAYARITEKHLDTLKKNRSLWAELHYKTGWIYYHAGLKDEARKYMRRALGARGRLIYPRAWAAVIIFEVLGAKAGAALHRALSEITARLLRLRG